MSEITAEKIQVENWLGGVSNENTSLWGKKTPK